MTRAFSTLIPKEQHELTVGVIAEIDEDRVTPVNRRTGQLGGKVFRTARKEVLSAVIERNIAALEEELRKLEAEFSESTGETKLDIQDKIENRQADLLINTSRAKLRAEELTREAAAKIFFARASCQSGRRPEGQA